MPFWILFLFLLPRLISTRFTAGRNFWFSILVLKAMFRALPPPERLDAVLEHLLEEGVINEQPPETSPPSEDQAAVAEDLIEEVVQDVPPPAEQPAPDSSTQALTKIYREITAIVRFFIEEPPLIKEELTQLFRQVLADEIPITTAAAQERRGNEQETALPQSGGNDQETQETAITDPAAQTEPPSSITTGSATEPPSSDIIGSETEPRHQNERADQFDNRLSTNARGTQMTTAPFNPLQFIPTLRTVPPPSNFTGESSAAAENRGAVKETDEDDGEGKQDKS